MKRRTRRGSTRGVTLVEIAVGAAIVGVLATLGFVTYRAVVSSARVSEATHFVEEIRTAQEKHFSEVHRYANISKDINATYPAAAPGNFKTAWGGACGLQCNSNIDWRRLTVVPDGPLVFGYATVAGGSGTNPSTLAPITLKTGAVDYAAINGGEVKAPWFVVHAIGDTNGDGVKAHVVSHSFNNQLIVEDED